MKASPEAGTITALLRRANDVALDPHDRQQAADLLFDRVYRLLLTRAQAKVRRENAADALTPVSVLSEVYIDLFHKAEIEWKDREHFFNLVSAKIRHVLVANARKRARQKRGGGRIQTTLTDAQAAVRPEAEKTSLTLVVEDVLERVERENPRDAKIAEFLFYCGFTERETAELTSVSVSTVERIKRNIKKLIISRCIEEDLRYGERSSGRTSQGPGKEQR